MTAFTAKPEGTGKRIRERRKALGFTLDHVATLVGVTRAAVNKWEISGATNIGAENLFKLSLVLRCNRYELIGMVGSADSIRSIDVSRLAQAIEIVDVMLSKHKIKLSPISKAKLLLYLSDGDRALPSETEAMRLVELAK
jgi:transcriptional regulator with XRE-family HTH domain